MKPTTWEITSSPMLQKYIWTMTFLPVLSPHLPATQSGPRWAIVAKVHESLWQWMPRCCQKQNFFKAKCHEPVIDFGSERWTTVYLAHIRVVHTPAYAILEKEERSMGRSSTGLPHACALSRRLVIFHAQYREGEWGFGSRHSRHCGENDPPLSAKTLAPVAPVRLWTSRCARFLLFLSALNTR